MTTINFIQLDRRNYIYALEFLAGFVIQAYYIPVFQYISNKMQHYTVYLYLETALHVSSGASTHHQERIQLYLQHLVVTPLLLPPASGR